MHLSLYRQVESAISTQGELFCDGKHVCYTLERPAVGEYHRIPAGSYTITVYNSPHFGRQMPLLVTPELPENFKIEIHWGNTPGASHGCILIGKQKGQDAIYFTRDAFDALFPAIAQAVGAEGCSIQIFNPPSQPPLGVDLATQV